MATTNSALSFQGLSSGIQTDALVSAILSQEGAGVRALQARQDRIKATATALTSMKSSMNTLGLSLSALKDKFDARLVTSTDANGTNVTATATGAATGTYDLNVATVATKGRISATLVGGVPQNLAVTDPAAAIFTSAKASFAIQGTDGVLKAFELTDNSLNGLKNAINASGAGVSATIVNTGSGTNPYQLVISAKDTGTGTTGGVVTLAAIDNQDSSASTVNASLGITAGSIQGTFAAPTNLAGGLSSSTSGQTAVDAVFTLNGITLTRQTNVVKDAAEGMTFTLKQGGQTGTTTLTVAQDKGAATTGMLDVISKFNALVKGYKDASTSTKNADGSINQASLAGEANSRSFINQIRAALTGVSAGLPSSSAFQFPANLGIRTQADGTLSLDTTTFQAALDSDPAAAKRLFMFRGDSDNGAVTVKSGTSATATGTVGFTIDSYTTGGAVSGTFTGTANGPITLTGTNGTLIGSGDLDGLTLSVIGTGTGTLTLSRGAGQSAIDLISKYTGTGSGTFSEALKVIDTQNRNLTTQIDAGQAALDRRKKVLQAQFSKMEVMVAQMRASASSLTGA